MWAGRVKLEDKLRFEAWTGERFEPVRTVDLTRNLLHPGVMLLYLPKSLPTHSRFGMEGCWLRLSRSSYLENSGGWPRVNAVRLNMVEAVQRQRAEEQIFSAGIYEANKLLSLLRRPILDCQVWVDEAQALAVADAEALAAAMPRQVELEWDDRVLAHCWVRWERRDELALAGAGGAVLQSGPLCRNRDLWQRHPRPGPAGGREQPAGSLLLRRRQLGQPARWRGAATYRRPAPDQPGGECDSHERRHRPLFAGKGGAHRKQAPAPPE